MTQKQTDYDKAKAECLKSLFENEFKAKKSLVNYENQIFDFAFRKGYEYGRKVRSEEVNLVLIADGEPYATARERVFNESYSKFCESSKGLNVGLKCTSAYQQGWNDSETFDEAWVEKHPEDLRTRLEEYAPEIIEKIKREAVQEYLETSQKAANCDIDHFRDSTKMMRYEIAKEIMHTLVSTEDMIDHILGKAYNLPHIANCAVALADALINELGKDEL